MALERVGEKGFIIGVDLEPVKAKVSPNFAFLKKDIYDADLETALKEIIEKPFDVVLSDAAPKTTGQKDIDQWRSHELVLRVFDIVKDELKKGGAAAVKVFEGPDTPEVIRLFREVFRRVRHYGCFAPPTRSRPNIYSLNVCGSRPSTSAFVPRSR